MGLPEYDPVRLTIEGEDGLQGTQADAELLDADTAGLWMAGTSIRFVRGGGWRGVGGVTSAEISIFVKSRIFIRSLSIQPAVVWRRRFFNMFEHAGG